MNIFLLSWLDQLWEGEVQVWRAGHRFANQNSRMLWSTPNEGKEITPKVYFSGHVCKRTELSTQVILWRIEVEDQGIRGRENVSICFSEALWEYAQNPTLLCLGATAGEFWAHLENFPEAAGTPSHPSTQVTDFGADGHWLCRDALGRQQWVIGGYQGDWPAPGQCWHSMEGRMPSAFTPLPSPWW